MPFSQPSRSDVHVNRPLTNISIAFLQNAENFVAGQVFPNIPVSKQSDQYFTIARGEYNRAQMVERAPGTESAGANYMVATDTYFAKTRALHQNIADQIRANADSPLNLDRQSTEFLTTQGLITREVNWAASYFTAGDPSDTWTFDTDGATTRSTVAAFDPTDAANNQLTFWSNAASTPIEDVRQGKRTVLENTGFMPNTLTVGRPVFDILLDHPDIVGRLDRGQTSGPAMATRDSLAALFEVDRVLVMDSIQNTAVEGQTDVHAFIGGKHGLLSYRPASPGLMTPAAGYTFSWTGLIGSGNDGMRIKRFRQEQLESDRIEIQMSYDQKVVSADLGYFFGSIVE